jgi:hypothetical protein
VRKNNKIILSVFFTGIPEIIVSKIEESKRFVLVMSKNVTTDPMCIWACEVAVEQAISGQNLKQLISIYPADKKRVCSHRPPCQTKLFKLIFFRNFSMKWRK